MARAPMVVAGAALALVLVGCGPATPTPPGSTAQPSPGAGTADTAAIGRAFVEALATGDLAAAEAMEDDTMRSAAPAAALGTIWEQLIAQFGSYGGIGEVATATQTPYTIATVATTFATAVVPLLVTVDARGRVAGFHLGQPVPAGSPAPSGSPGVPASPAASPPAYVDPDAFTETEVTVGFAPWELPGTLAMPAGEGLVPAVVLLAGSGPNDRDETIGPNAPLRDLAQGLASNGIAVLRYDKRTKVHGPAMAAAGASVTVREEVIDDALAAIDLLRATPGVDPGRIAVVGHSLGAYLAPRIAAEAGSKVAGIALLAGNSSPLAQVILAQLEYLASPEGGADPQAAAQLPTIREQVALAESPDLSPTTPASRLPLGIPAAYWLDLRAHDPVAIARGLAVPMLLVQGGRDYQVPPSELAAWRAALAGRPGVTFREYPPLNHLLIAGEGPSRPAEYAVPGHVAPEVVADLAAWILDQ